MTNAKTKNPLADIGQAIAKQGQWLNDNGYNTKTPLSLAIKKQSRAIDKALLAFENGYAPIDKRQALAKLAKARAKLAPLIAQCENELAKRIASPADYENCPYGQKQILWHYPKLIKDANFLIKLPPNGHAEFIASENELGRGE